MKNVTPPDTLHTCPKCGTGGFINLKSHICKGPKPGSGAVAKVAPGAAFAVAKRYHEQAVALGVASVAHMVMCGVELERLHGALGETRGRPADGHKFQPETYSFEALCQEHVGVSKATAWRYRQLARSCGKKVKPLAKMLSSDAASVTDAERKKVFGIVTRAVDGHSASEILTEWGLGKKKEAPRLTAEQEANIKELESIDDDHERASTAGRQARRDKALADWTELGANLTAYGLKNRSFLLLPDEAIRTLRKLFTDILALLPETPGK